MSDWEAYAKKIEHDLRQRIAELEAREPLCRCADEVRCDYLKRIEELEACCRHRDEQITTLHNFNNAKDKRIEELEAVLENEDE